MYPARVVSGMRPTGAMHLGHYHGALKNWVRIQNEVESLFFVADWHALTTHYDEVETIEQSTWDMVVDWLAAGIDPEKASVFVQSRVLEHAELTLLLGMATPLGWLERVPTYKDQIEKIAHKDLATFGFLGYPVMMAADVLVYRANQVPVGEDQIPHIEIMREMARRFNYIYGREKDFAEKAQEAVKKMGGKVSRQFLVLRSAWQEKGDANALAEAKTLLESAGSLSMADRERLVGWLEGTGKQILVEPQVLLTEASRLPGLDGQKMSKSYGNAISLRENRDEVNRKIRTMQTDPARVRRTDPGDPEKCPVWQFHVVYSDADTKEWVQKGCRSAGIGCIECKQPVIEAIIREQEPFHERAQKYLDNPAYVREIVAAGCEKARRLAQETMRDVRDAMGLNYGDHA
ncbi:tryptophan--tRNA ligase [Oxalobacter sp. OttesenSCG-928-P03]|nr:tryptophan--tRNA ligase [Oxalobacter sp. OttesenSCG-928-P03]